MAVSPTEPTLPDRRWMRHAACVGPHAGSGLPWTTDADQLPIVIGDLMRATCDACLVRAQSRTFVAEAGITGGFWAGSDRDEEPGQIGLEGAA